MPLNSAIHRIDAALTDSHERTSLRGFPRLIAELWYFGLKQMRAGLFAEFFFAAVFLMPREGVLGLPRYDALLLFALCLQAWMIARGIESWAEARTILFFHLAGFTLEVFKVSSGIQSWVYPDFAYSKVLGVPLFAGFMYAAVGSYLMQAWRIFDVRIIHHPPYWMTATLALALYANFFTHHFIIDVRWYLAAFALGLYARCWVYFTPLDRERRMPLLLAFILVGLLIWIAENIATFFSIWRYPDQIGVWSTVQIDKWSAWTLLSMLSFSIVTSMHHVRARIHFME